MRNWPCCVWISLWLGFWATVCKTIRPVLSELCRMLVSCPPVLSDLSVTLVYWGLMAGWIKMPLGTEIGPGAGHIVPASPKWHNPQFSAHVCCGQTAGWIKMSLGTEVGLCPGHSARLAGPSSPTKRGTAAPHFSAHVYCGQTVAHLSNCWALLRPFGCTSIIWR